MRLEVAPDLANVSAARRFVRANLEGVVPPAVSDDLQLAASELVTNAIVHGAPGLVVVTVDADTTSAAVTVWSRGDAPTVDVDPDRWRVADSDRISGRGLGIVRQLADDVDVVRSDDDLTITVRRFVDVSIGTSSGTKPS